MVAETTTPSAETIEEHARAILAGTTAPGISVAVVDGAEVVYADGFGHRRLDPDRPATAETLYGIGSSTKPITATAVMGLVDDGAISLDDPVSEYVPYFGDAPGDPVEVGELLSHTSGMPADDVATITILDAVLGDEFEHSIRGWEDFREYVEGSVDRRRLDGERCLYYNTGYVVLSRLVEVVTDTPFGEYVTETVLAPVGMDRSTFDVGVLDDESRDVMTPYMERDDELHGVDLPDDPLFEGPGGLQAPVTDMGEFVAAWTERDLPIEGDLAGAMIEPKGTFRTFLDGSSVGYGYGWMTRPFDDDVVVGHGGGTGVSGGYVGFLRDRGLGIALGCNAQPDQSPERLALELLSAITDTDPATVLPKRAIERKERRVTGEYAGYGGIQTATVARGDEGLEVAVSSPFGTESTRLLATSLDPDDYTFRVANGSGKRSTAEFFVDPDGVELLLNRNLYERVGDLDDGDGGATEGNGQS